MLERTLVGSCPGANARSWEALGGARPGQSSLSAGARRYRAWAQSWSSAALAARSVLPSNRPATPLFSPACWEPGFQAWAQSPCPELSAQGLLPLRWGCDLIGEFPVLQRMLFSFLLFWSLSLAVSLWQVYYIMAAW